MLNIIFSVDSGELTFERLNPFSHNYTQLHTLFISYEHESCKARE